jgi:hypothetical protein
LHMIMQCSLGNFMLLSEYLNEGEGWLQYESTSLISFSRNALHLLEKIDESLKVFCLPTLN